jgi:hypothetical protein
MGLLALLGLGGAREVTAGGGGLLGGQRLVPPRLEPAAHHADVPPAVVEQPVGRHQRDDAQLTDEQQRRRIRRVQGAQLVLESRSEVEEQARRAGLACGHVGGARHPLARKLPLGAQVEQRRLARGEQLMRLGKEGGDGEVMGEGGRCRGCRVWGTGQG